MPGETPGKCVLKTTNCTKQGVNLWGPLLLSTKRKAPRSELPRKGKAESVIQVDGDSKATQEPSSLADEVTPWSLKQKNEQRGTLGKQRLGAIAGQQAEDAGSPGAEEKKVTGEGDKGRLLTAQGNQQCEERKERH